MWPKPVNGIWVCFCATIAVAYLSFHYVETRFYKHMCSLKKWDHCVTPETHHTALLLLAVSGTDVPLPEDEAKHAGTYVQFGDT